MGSLLHALRQYHAGERDGYTDDPEGVPFDSLALEDLVQAAANLGRVCGPAKLESAPSAA